MARMDRREFEEFVRNVLVSNFDDNGAPPDVVDAVVDEIGGKFEDADLDAYFEGRDVGYLDGTDREERG
jgi:hypothetical protein